VTTPIIQLDKLTKKYEEQLAVNNLSLSIHKGEIFGLLGPNGAGKTTTILMMLGLSEPTSGNITVCGINPTRNPIAVKKKVGYLPDDVGFYQHMTGLENLLYTAQLNGIPLDEAKKRAHHLLQKVDLLDAADKKTGKYSRGMRQRLGLADVLMKKPEVIILDEPTLGIDPEGVRDFLKLIRELNEEEQMTVLLSSHHLHQVQQICDRVGIFVKGELLAAGDMESLAKQLFVEDTFVIEIKVQPIHKELIERLQTIPNVNKVETVPSGIEIYCKEDVSAAISRAIIESGASLYQLQKKNFGLDEIYHRYFEGGNPDGIGLTKK
jgi:ABC-2 type transport system ATP-binding protein